MRGGSTCDVDPHPQATHNTPRRRTQLIAIGIAGPQHGLYWANAADFQPFSLGTAAVVQGSRR